MSKLRHLVMPPADYALAARIAWFVARAPSRLAHQDLPRFLAGARGARRPAATDVRSGRRRIARLRRLVLRVPGLRARNTCYMRALTMYRFLDAGDATVRFHVGVEERDDPATRLHGHAWVSVDGVVIEEGPLAVGRPMREVDVDPR